MLSEIFPLKPSRYFIVLLFVIYSALLICLVFSDISVFISLLFILTAIFSLYYSYQAQRAWTYLVRHPETGWKVFSHDGKVYNIDRENEIFCSRFMVILKSESAKKNIIIFLDAMLKKDFKQVRRYFLNGS